MVELTDDLHNSPKLNIYELLNFYEFNDDFVIM